MIMLEHEKNDNKLKRELEILLMRAIIQGITIGFMIGVITTIIIMRTT